MVNGLIAFRGNGIRRTLHNNELWFYVVDVVATLTDSDNPKNYWSVLKHRLSQEGSEPLTICKELKMVATDGKMRFTDCANTEGFH
jgi:hypothetical protein